MLNVSAFVYLVGVASSFQNLTGSSPDVVETDCLNLIQQAHALEFDLDVSMKRLHELGQKVSNVRDLEGSAEADFSEMTKKLKASQWEYKTDAQQAARIEGLLTQAQGNVIALAGSVNATMKVLAVLEGSAKNSTSSIDALRARRDENESNARKSELSLQMLVNDLETGNKTLEDSRSVLAERRGQVSSLSSTIESLSARSRQENSTMTLLEEKRMAVARQLEKAERDLTDAQQARGRELRKMHAIQQNLTHVKSELESERSEIFAKNRAIAAYVNSTIVPTQIGLAHIKLEELNLTRRLEAKKNETRILQGGQTEITVNEGSLHPEETRSKLRQSIRRSKMFLASEGYGDRFSLAQIGSVDSELTLFQDRSDILSLEEEIRQRSSDEVASERSRDS